MTLSAAQVIYTNVERRDSPAGRDGYQVWLRTADALDAADESALVSRLADFEARDAGSGESPVRHMYCVLPSGSAAIARTVALSEADRFNRGGRFYAHALVLTAADFRRFDNDPFAVLDQLIFQSSLEDGRKAGDAARGTIPAAALDERAARNAPAPLEPDRLAALLPSVLRACGRDKPVILGVPGLADQALALVRQLFIWLPPTLRLACSFDTLSTGRSLTQAPFAIVGLPPAGPPRRYLNLLLFDPIRLGFTQPPPAAALGLFGEWLLNQVTTAAEPPPASRSEAAYQLGRALDQGGVVTGELAGVDAALFEEIACSESGVPKMERLLRARLEADVGAALAALLFALAHNWLRSTGLEALRKLGEPIAPALLLRWLLALYADRRGEEIDSADEVPALKEVLERTKGVEGEGVALRKRLVLTYYRWGERWPTIAKSVRDAKMIPDDVYQWFVGWALATVPVRVTLGAGVVAGGAWCGPQVVCAERGREDECQKLVGALLGLDASDGERLPTERWEWALHHLMSLVE